jgi:hypothetical protein
MESLIMRLVIIITCLTSVIVSIGVGVEAFTEEMLLLPFAVATLLLILGGEIDYRVYA